LWRIGHDSVPHRCNIARKGIDIDPLCLVCGRLNDDGAHLFLKCKGVKQVWRRLGLEENRQAMLRCDGPKEMLNYIFKLDQSKQIICVAVLWEWWKHRNKINAENAKLNCDGVVIQVKRSAQDYGQFCVPSSKVQVQTKKRWKPPDADRLKVNIDGSFFASSRRGGWGFVLRDHRGQVLGSAAGKIEKANDALYTEAVACLKAIELLSDWGIEDVEVEADAAMLIKAATTADLDLSINGILFKEIRALSVANFKSISFSFSPRACNEVANALAMHGAKMVYVPQAVWPGYAPAFAQVLVDSDIAVLSG
jgi:ribonuclease HI